MKESNFEHINRQLFKNKQSPPKVQRENHDHLKSSRNLNTSRKTLKESIYKENHAEIFIKESMIKEMTSFNQNNDKEKRKLVNENQRLKIQKQQLKIRLITFQNEDQMKKTMLKESGIKNVQQMQQSLEQYRKYIIKLQQQKDLLQKTLKKEKQWHKVEFRRLKQQFQQQRTQLTSKNLTKQQQLINIQKILTQRIQEYHQQLHLKQQQLIQTTNHNHHLKQQIQSLHSTITTLKTQQSQLQHTFKNDIYSIQSLIHKKQKQITSFYQYLQLICQQFKSTLQLQSQNDDYISLLKMFIKQLKPRGKINEDQILKLKDQLEKIRNQNVGCRNKINILEEEIKFIKNNHQTNFKFANIIKNHLSQTKQMTKQYKTPQRVKYQSKTSNNQHQRNSSPLLQVKSININQNKSPIRQLNDHHHHQTYHHPTLLKHNVYEGTIKNSYDKLKIVNESKQAKLNSSAIIAKYDSLEKVHSNNDKIRKMYELKLNQKLMDKNQLNNNYEIIQNNDPVDKSHVFHQKMQLTQRKRSLVNILYSKDEKSQIRCNDRLLQQGKSYKRKRASSLISIVSNKCRDQLS